MREAAFINQELHRRSNPSNFVEIMSEPSTHASQRVIWLVRHGNRVDFATADWGETAARPHDPPLSADGVVQAREVGKRLKTEPIAHLFASPFLRTVETAAEISRELNLPVKIEDGFCEQLLPNWFPTRPELLAPAELSKTFPQVDPGYQASGCFTWPETEDQMHSRTAKTIRVLLGKFDGNFLIVTHGAPLLGICRALLGREEKIHFGLCCLVKLARHGDEWRLELDGSDESHLSAPRSGLRLV